MHAHLQPSHAHGAITEGRISSLCSGKGTGRRREGCGEARYLCRGLEDSHPGPMRRGALFSPPPPPPTCAPAMMKVIWQLYAATVKRLRQGTGESEPPATCGLILAPPIPQLGYLVGTVRQGGSLPPSPSDPTPAYPNLLTVAAQLLAGLCHGRSLGGGGRWSGVPLPCRLSPAILPGVLGQLGQACDKKGHHSTPTSSMAKPSQQL